MKLRNKKTGEVKEFNEIFLTTTVKETNTATSEYVECSYRKIDALNEEWEDYKPKEPLIKDEKIRKAVRAWAEANGFNADYYEFNIKTLPAGTRFSVGHYDIEFIGFFIYDLQTENSYTLAKLCGKDEE